MLEDVALHQPGRRSDFMPAVGGVNQVRIQRTVGQRHPVGHREPELHAVLLNFRNFRHPVEIIGGRRTVDESAIVGRRPQTGIIICGAQHRRIIARAIRINRLARLPKAIGIGFPAQPAQAGRRIGQANPKVAILIPIGAKLVKNPVLLIRVAHRGQMAAQLLRPILRSRRIGGPQQIIIMTVHRTQERPGRDHQIGHQRIGRHAGQPLHQRLRQRRVRGVNPAFHREARPRAHIQRRGLHQHIRPANRHRARRRRLRNLHIGVRARINVELTRIDRAKGLAHFAARERKPTDQPAVVRIVLRIRTVRRIALPAPPTVNARTTIPISNVVLPSRHGRHHPGDRTVGQRQVIAAGLGVGWSRYHADRVVGQRHIVGHQHQVAIRQQITGYHQVRRHRPASLRVRNIRGPHVGEVGVRFKIAQRKIAARARHLIRRNPILDRHRRQIGVFREGQILKIRHRRPDGIIPPVTQQAVRVAELVHDDRQQG